MDKDSDDETKGGDKEKKADENKDKKKEKKEKNEDENKDKKKEKKEKKEKNEDQNKEKESSEKEKKKPSKKKEDSNEDEELSRQDKTSTTSPVDRSKLSTVPENFQLRVRVISGRQLAGSNLRPVVRLKANKGQVKTTKVRKGSSPIWNEMLMFNFNMSLKELYDVILEICVNNSNKMRSDSLIGSFKLDLGSVHEQPDHAHIRKWILLTDPEDSSNSPKGYLKATICVLGAGAKPPNEKEGDVDDDDDDMEGNLLTPAGASLRSSNLLVRVYCAQDLPDVEESAAKALKKIFGGSKPSKASLKPYFCLTFAGKKIKTKKIKGTLAPEWNNEMNLPFNFPSMCDTIKLLVKHRVKLGSDDVIGTSCLRISEISSTGDGGDDEGFLPTFGPTYINFYGSPRDQKKTGSLKGLNSGKGEGCSYRGRALIELFTSLDGEEEGEPPPIQQEISEENVELSKNLFRRQRYRLVVCFNSANMIDRHYDDIQFEVSIGKYGNKLDADLVSTSYSVTEPSSTAFDGCKYFYLSWSANKPVVVVTSQWENVNFRYYSLNFILQLQENVKTAIHRIKVQMEQREAKVDVAASLVEVLDKIILSSLTVLPDPREYPASNDLDSFLYEQRLNLLYKAAEQAKELRQTCTDVTKALNFILEFIDNLKTLAYEPQNSLPDIIIWMISGGKKRVAYARIPAHEFMYCEENPSLSGKFCAKIKQVHLKVPSVKAYGKSNNEAFCSVSFTAWFGLLQDQKHFDLKTNGKLSFCHETFEFQTKHPFKGWVPDGFKNKSGKISLPKETFLCPTGWRWKGSWTVSSEAPQVPENDLETKEFFECYIYNIRNDHNGWKLEKVVDQDGNILESIDSISCPKKWVWCGEWIEASKLEFGAPMDDMENFIWKLEEKTFHVSQRQRFIRFMKKQKLGRSKHQTILEPSDKWEYSASSSGDFHSQCRALDMSRRRKWIRTMVASDVSTSEAIFKLEKTVIKSLSFLQTAKKTQSQAGSSLSKLQVRLASQHVDDSTFKDSDYDPENEEETELVSLMNHILLVVSEVSNEEKNLSRNLMEMYLSLSHGEESISDQDISGDSEKLRFQEETSQGPDQHDDYESVSQPETKIIIPEILVEDIDQVIVGEKDERSDGTMEEVVHGDGQSEKQDIISGMLKDDVKQITDAERDEEVKSSEEEKSVSKERKEDAEVEKDVESKLKTRIRKDDKSDVEPHSEKDASSGDTKQTPNVPDQTTGKITPPTREGGEEEVQASTSREKDFVADPHEVFKPDMSMSSSKQPSHEEIKTDDPSRRATQPLLLPFISPMQEPKGKDRKKKLKQSKEKRQRSSSFLPGHSSPIKERKELVTMLEEKEKRLSSKDDPKPLRLSFSDSESVAYTEPIEKTIKSRKLKLMKITGEASPKKSQVDEEKQKSKPSKLKSIFSPKRKQKEKASKSKEQDIKESEELDKTNIEASHEVGSPPKETTTMKTTDEKSEKLTKDVSEASLAQPIQTEEKTNVSVESVKNLEQEQEIVPLSEESKKHTVQKQQDQAPTTPQVKDVVQGDAGSKQTKEKIDISPTSDIKSKRDEKPETRKLKKPKGSDEKSKHRSPSRLKTIFSPRRKSKVEIQPTVEDEEPVVSTSLIDGKGPEETQEKDETEKEAKDEVEKKKKEEIVTKEKEKKMKKKKELPLPQIYIMYDQCFVLHLRAYIYQGRNLLAMGKNNFSDTIVFVSFINQCCRTRVAKHSLNPIWNETLMMDILYYGDLERLRDEGCQIFLELFHKGKKFSANPFKTKGKKSSKPVQGKLKFMGRTAINADLRLSHNDARATTLEWVEVTKGRSEAGDLLSAVDVFLKNDDDVIIPPPPPRNPIKKYKDLFTIPIGIRPVLQRTALEIIIWGVRNMNPFKLLSVDNPLVLIQIGEVEIRTKPLKNSKKNPNFPDPIYFRIENLPAEEKYFPPIVIRVKDNRKFGVRPTVGQYVISDVEKYRIESQPPPIEIDEEKPAKIQENTVIEMEKQQSPEKEALGGLFSGFSSFTKSTEAEVVKDDSVDWWTRYFASCDGTKGDEKDFRRLGLKKIKIYNDVLEKQDDFNEFQDFVESFRLTRGKFKEGEDPEIAGEFKGAFKIYQLSDDYNDPLPPRVFKNIPSSGFEELIVRVYIVRGFDLASQQSNGLADPYIKLKAGKIKVSDRKNYVPNTINPTFGRMLEVTVKIPIQKDLFVQVYDWNLIGIDEKIGETVIDLENRYFTRFRAWCGLPKTYETSGPSPWRDQMTPKEWLSEKCVREGWDEPVWNGNTAVMVDNKLYSLVDFEQDQVPSKYEGEPDQRLCLHILRTFSFVPEHIESRPLFSKLTPGIEQGRLHLWVDIFPKQFGVPGEPFVITPRKPTKHFVRVVVWNCTDIPLTKTSFSGEKTADLYVKGWITGLERKKQKTDVHYRSMDGSGMFNWRFIFPFQYMPQEGLVYAAKKEHLWSSNKTVQKFPPVLNMQVWNNDLFGPNKHICEIVLPLLKMAKCCKFKRSCNIKNIPDQQGNCAMEIVSAFDQTSLKGWWPLYKIEDGKKVQAGKLEMSLEVVDEEDEKERPAGPGRKEPNDFPKLDKPKRPATSFAWFSSPFKSLRYIIWRRYKWYIIAFLLLGIVIAFVVLLFYNLPNALMMLMVQP